MAGILIEGKAEVIINGTVVRKNGGGGVVVKGEGSLKVLGGTQISENYGHGIAVFDGDGAKLDIADATIENNGFEMAFDVIGVDRAVVDEALLIALIDKTIELDGKVSSKEDLLDAVLAWLNTTGIIATVASSEPYTAAAAAVVAFGVEKLKDLKQRLG